MILVTGGSGFLGQHLVKELATAGKKIRAVYHSHPPQLLMKQFPEVEWLQCDLLDVFAVEEVMEGIRQIFHCAAIVSFLPRDQKKMLHFNVESTNNIVNEALLQGVEKIVHLSSVAALGRREDKQNISEEEQLEDPKHSSAYGLSKHLSEMELWRAAGEGLKAVSLNPGIILGAPVESTDAAWDAGSARLMKVVFKEFPFYTAGINAFADVRDVARIAVLMMEQDVPEERFIVSAGNFSYKEIFTKMAEALEKKPPHLKAARWMSALVWRWSLLRSKLFGETATITKETARNAQTQSFYDNRKLLNALYDFQYTPISETIQNMADAYLLHTKGKR